MHDGGNATDGMLPVASVTSRRGPTSGRRICADASEADRVQTHDGTPGSYHGCPTGSRRRTQLYRSLIQPDHTPNSFILWGPGPTPKETTEPSLVRPEAPLLHLLD
jgi:hypothetical protein